ncbi:MAG: YbaB/EbfC family nucleoid-associated protein [Candidatus Shapirobacteria bacterium]
MLKKFLNRGGKMFDKLKQLGELKKMRDQAVQIQKQLAARDLTVEENGVKIVITGEQKIKELTVQGVANLVMIEVLNKAIKKSQEMAAKRLQEMSGGLSGLLGNLGK